MTKEEQPKKRSQPILIKLPSLLFAVNDTIKFMFAKALLPIDLMLSGRVNVITLLAPFKALAAIAITGLFKRVSSTSNSPL